MNYVPPKRSDGTIQRRRKSLPWHLDRPFKILVIDGGGICGILPASVLAELENRFLNGRSVVEHFDMIAGTSTGGIIALALAHGLTAREIQKFYVERGGLVFPPSNAIGRMWKRLRRFHRYAYDSHVLEQELLGIFGDVPFGNARTRLCIPSFEGVHGEPWIYKTPHHPDYQKDRVERMVKVGLATSAAPTYYRAMSNSGYIMVDGGLWANNPIMNAVTDALACYDVDRSQVRVLSLGCGETSFRVDPVKAVGGMIQWKDAIRAAMRAQSLNALGQTFMLIGKENVVRLDAPETPTPIQLDDHRRAKVELPAMARALVEGSGHLVESLFLTETVAPYIPSIMTKN